MLKKLPLSYHNIWCQGVCLAVDDEVRREVENWLAKGDERSAILMIETVTGDDVTLASGFVSAIWSTTPEGRRLDREHQKMHRDEVPVEDR